MASTKKATVKKIETSAQDTIEELRSRAKSLATAADEATQVGFDRASSRLAELAKSSADGAGTAAQAARDGVDYAATRLETVGDWLESAGDYLRSADRRRVAEDVRTFAGRHRTLLAVVAGIMVGRAWKRRS